MPARPCVQHAQITPQGVIVLWYPNTQPENLRLVAGPNWARCLLVIEAATRDIDPNPITQIQEWMTQLQEVLLDILHK